MDSRTPQGPRAHGPPSDPSREKEQTQDWVSESPERRRSGRRWSVSIHERRRRAELRGRDAAGTPSLSPDITQIVAALVSEDVDRDVLLPHPPRSAAATHAFENFLARSSPFWRSVVRTSSSPPP